MRKVCQYSKLESFKNLKINDVQISLCLQDHMKQCRWEADGSSLLRGQQKGLASIWSIPGLPFSLLPGCRNSEMCTPKYGSVTGWTLHYTQRLREASCPP